MSRSPYFFVEKFNSHTKKYELQHPIIWNYDHTERVTADLYPYNGDHDLFSIVTSKDYSAFPRMDGIHNGIPEDSCEEIKKSFNDCSYDTEWSGETHHIEPSAHWFTYADMLIYCLQHPMVKDYDAIEEAYYYAQEGEKVDENIMKPTPMNNLKNRIDAFLEVMDEYDWKNDYSLIRIVYWIL